MQRQLTPRTFFIFASIVAVSYYSLPLPKLVLATLILVLYVLSGFLLCTYQPTETLFEVPGYPPVPASGNFSGRVWGLNLQNPGYAYQLQLLPDGDVLSEGHMRSSSFFAVIMTILGALLCKLLDLRTQPSILLICGSPLYIGIYVAFLLQKVSLEKEGLVNILIHPLGRRIKRLDRIGRLEVDQVKDGFYVLKVHAQDKHKKPSSFVLFRSRARERVSAVQARIETHLETSSGLDELDEEDDP